MSIQALHRGTCAKCGDWIEVGQDIDPGPPSTGGWAHTVCPEDADSIIVDMDDRPRCRFCGDVLTPDFECESCPG